MKINLKSDGRTLIKNTLVLKSSKFSNNFIHEPAVDNFLKFGSDTPKNKNIVEKIASSISQVMAAAIIFVFSCALKLVSKNKNAK